MNTPATLSRIIQSDPIFKYVQAIGVENQTTNGTFLIAMVPLLGDVIFHYSRQYVILHLPT